MPDGKCNTEIKKKDFSIQGYLLGTEYGNDIQTSQWIPN